MVAHTATLDTPLRARMDEALRASLGRSALITPQLCVAYMKALAADQERWQRHIQAVRPSPNLSREEALRTLAARGATPLTWYTRKTTSAREPSATRRRGQLGGPMSAWRPVRAGEFRAAISAALAPRGLRAARRSPPLLAHPEVGPAPAVPAKEMEKIALARRQRHAAADE